VQLPHDWLTWHLRGRPPELVTDRGDASGTGYWSPRENRYWPDLLHRAVGRDLALPRVAGPVKAVGRTTFGALVGPGTADNMAAALGLGLEVGDGTDVAGVSALAEAAAPGAGGLVLLPYLDGERTPNLPGATGALVGLTRAAMTPANLARAAVEGMLCGLADGVDALQAQGVAVDRVLLIGGAAHASAVPPMRPTCSGSW